MPLTPEDVSNKRFTPVRLREGYDMGEVDQFLDEVEAELARLTRENNDLRGKVTAAQQGKASAPEGAKVDAVRDKDASALKPVEPAPAPVEPAVQAIKVHTAADASVAAARLLEIATRNADELVGEARTEAEQIVSEARAEADRVQSEARSRSETLDAETEQRRSHMFGELDEERARLDGEVENLRSFEREYRSRLKVYFEQQLEALDGAGPPGSANHGRSGSALEDGKDARSR